MRMLMKITIPVEDGNEDARNGFKTIRTILEEQKPEAAYFIEEYGERTAILIVNLPEPSGIPELCEPWFLGLNATVELRPAMVPEDLAKSAPAVEKAVSRYGG